MSPLGHSMTRPFRIGRSSTMSDAQDRGAFSEDDRRESALETVGRPSRIRRFTGTRTPKNDRATSTTTQQWHRLKTSLKLLNSRKKDDHRFDHAKSAELMAELFAITPAAMMMFSMFQRDDHDRKRIPVLLEQVKVRVTECPKGDISVELLLKRGILNVRGVVGFEVEVGLNLRFLRLGVEDLVAGASVGFSSSSASASSSLVSSNSSSLRVSRCQLKDRACFGMPLSLLMKRVVEGVFRRGLPPSMSFSSLVC